MEVKIATAAIVSAFIPILGLLATWDYPVVGNQSSKTRLQGSGFFLPTASVLAVFITLSYIATGWPSAAGIEWTQRPVGFGGLVLSLGLHVLLVRYERRVVSGEPITFVMRNKATVLRYSLVRTAFNLSGMLLMAGALFLLMYSVIHINTVGEIDEWVTVITVAVAGVASVLVGAVYILVSLIPWKLVRANPDERRILIWGAGDLGDATMMRLTTASHEEIGFVPYLLGFVDDDPSTHGIVRQWTQIRGSAVGRVGALPVFGGTNRMEDLLPRLSVDEVRLAIQNPDRAKAERVKQTCLQYGVTLVDEALLT